MSLPSARPMVDSGLCNVRSTGAPSDGKKRIVAIPRARLVLNPTNDNACRGLAAGEPARGAAIDAFLVGGREPTRRPKGREHDGSNGRTGVQMRKSASFMLLALRWVLCLSSLAVVS